MKKIDKLTLKAFFSPFVLTTVIVVFIFLMRFIMLYFDEIVGKGLDLDVYLRLFFYFGLMTVPLALPLAILLSALMSFGNLGEHSELTAMKSAGIPLNRIMLPAIIISLLVAIGAFFYNNYVTPWANLKGYSLLYDIKTKKLTLNIQEGIFYNEIPGYRIKVDKKFPDNETLKGIMVYDHSKNTGNVSVTLADSGRMHTIMNDSYLVFELFNGQNYTEFTDESGNYNDTRFLRNRFAKNRLVFSLESFNIAKTDENQFKYHEYMQNVAQLNEKIDSTTKYVEENREKQVMLNKRSYNYMFREIVQQPVLDDKTKDTVSYVTILPGKWVEEKAAKLDTSGFQSLQLYQTAISGVESILSQLKVGGTSIESTQKEIYRAQVELWHKYTMSYVVLVMFVIGASLGAIIKKGGFGVPLLLAVSIFIFMYILMQLGDKYVKEGIWNVYFGVWMPDFVLSVLAIYLLIQATNDSKVFDNDFYVTTYNQFHQKLESLRKRS